MYRYLKYYNYYLELFFKRISGKGVMNPSSNGEFNVLENIVKMTKDDIVFVDGGANIGKHSMYFLKLCEKYNKKHSLLCIEPFPSTREVLLKNMKGRDVKLLPIALGEKNDTVKFYHDQGSVSGANSTIRHYYLNSGYIEIQQKNLDTVVIDEGISKIDFLKLDIEGAEVKALSGAKELLKEGKIKYIQLEYNQTWIKGGGSIEKVLDLCDMYGYQLFRITKKTLLSIPTYHYVLDDFFFSNLLLVSTGSKLPMKCTKKALPFL